MNLVKRNASQQPVKMNKSQILYKNLSKNLNETEYQNRQPRRMEITSKNILIKYVLDAKKYGEGRS